MIVKLGEEFFMSWSESGYKSDIGCFVWKSLNQHKLIYNVWFGMSGITLYVYLVLYFFGKQLSWIWNQRSSGSIVHCWQNSVKFSDQFLLTCRGLHLDMRLRYSHLLSPTHQDFIQWLISKHVIYDDGQVIGRIVKNSLTVQLHSRQRETSLGFCWLWIHAPKPDLVLLLLVHISCIFPDVQCVAGLPTESANAALSNYS